MVKKKTVQPEKDPASLTHTRVRLVELRSLAALINSAGCRGNLHVLRTAGATAIDRPHPPNGIAEADESQRLREKFLLGHDFGFLTLAEAGTEKSAFALPPPQGREGSAELFANRQAVVPQADCPTRGRLLASNAAASGASAAYRNAMRRFQKAARSGRGGSWRSGPIPLL